jgi:serine phosphatase RsbU (regulator of sigma subunit)
MTYKTARSVAALGTTTAAAFGFLIVPLVAVVGLNFPAASAVAALAFVVFYFFRDAALAAFDRLAYRLSFSGRETRLVAGFTERVGVCFTTTDLVDAIREKLEIPADMSAILLRSSNWEIVYQSSAAAANRPRLIQELDVKFRERPEGVWFMSERLEAQSSPRRSRGFVIISSGFHLFVFTRLCPYIEIEAFKELKRELDIHFNRVGTIAELFEMASLSREWELIAETQRSFLPKSLPSPAKLDLSVFYRPLVNVSGDYYDAIAVDDNRTLLIVGDVSGKGLAAALIMGIIMNTVRIAKDKSDLAGLVRAIDAAVRDMGFDDKYTVLFIGLVDTAKRTMRYVNAAMADPIIITQTATGPKVIRLEPTMGLIGLVPFDEVVVEELPLRTDEIILLASDGVTEVADSSGERLGETELFEKSLAQASKANVTDFVSSVSALLFSYVGDKPLKDDVTILAAKVGRLWD